MFLNSTQRRSARCIAFLTCFGVLLTGLLITPVTSARRRVNAPPQTQTPNGNARKVAPPTSEKGRPPLTLPNLDEVRRQRPANPEIKPAIESNTRSKRKPLQKWDGRKVGDPGTTGVRSENRSQTSPNDSRAFHHSSRPVGRKGSATLAPPLMPDDSYVQSFVGNALGRSINTTEQTYWDDILRSAYPQGTDSLLTATRDMGRTLFESAEYQNRGRSNHDYVWDLYMTYLMRDPTDPNNPDYGGWNFWTSVCDSSGRAAVRAAFDGSGEFYNKVASLTPNGGIVNGAGSIATARVDPFNQSGDQLEARDCEWSLPLISLPGRAGLDLGLSLSYSSQVWTHSGPYIYFDEDISQISPGFHLGFAAIQGPYFDTLTHKKVYILVSSAGRRVELRQVGDGVYEAADSSYLQLVEGGHSSAQEVNWTNVSGVSVNGGTLAATYGYWAAGASSTQTIPSGDGYVETTIAETNTYRMIGLSNGDSDQSYSDIDFAWYPAADGNLYIYESGTYVGSFGTYAIGDGLRVAVEGGTVKYYKNGQVIYTSTHAPSYPLLVDTSFYTPGATLNNVVIKNGSGLNAPSGTLLLYSSDGTQISYSSYANDWQATQIKDSNGNYLTISNDWRGDISTITDTLGRVLYFNNDSYGNLQSITQYWNWNGTWHTWATFGWGTVSMNLSGLSGVVGTYTNEQVPVLTQVGLPDGSYYVFDYHSDDQVYMIERWTGDNVERSYLYYDYENSIDNDCPRIYQMRVWADNWTGINGVPSQVISQFSARSDGGHQMITPDGTLYIDYYGSGFQNGLVTDSRVYAPGLQKQTTITYTQDNPSVSYQTNPRVTQTMIADPYGNYRRTTIDYQPLLALPSVVTEYAADTQNVIRRTYFDYVNDSPYISRRILGLPFRHRVYDGSGNLVIKTEYYYDWGAEHMQNTPAAPIQHDSSYDVNFLVRGNLADVAQFDATDQNNGSKLHEFKKGYDIAGNVTFTRDPLWHQNFVSYTDSFSAGGNRNSFAYPTTMTDPDGYSSYIQYNYDFGAKTQVQTPQPNTTSNTAGPIQYFSYDGIGRIYQTSNSFNGAYVTYLYGTYYSYTLSSTNNLANELYAVQVFDGLGRVVQSATNNPGSAGGYKASWTQFDVMGRAVRQYNPTEIDGYWNLSGDDAGGRYYTQQTYDWKGRPLVTTNQDGTTKEAIYTGCGCAGGEIAVTRDEVGRRQKVTADVLGRQWKIEVLYEEPKDQPLNGDGSVYSTVVNTFNALDQVTNARQTDNATGAYQDTTMSYDGYGRLQTKHVPQQNAGSATLYSYNTDDTVGSVTDARGAVATYGYNGRHQVRTVSNVLTGYSTINVGYEYDAAGNRISMTHAIAGAPQDSAGYGYDQLSRMSTETRHINALEGYYPNYGNFTINYSQYNLAGQVKTVTDPFNSTTNLSYDDIGRTASVTGTSGGTNVNYMTNVTYRAWGAVKSENVGDDYETVGYNSRLQPTQYRMTYSSYNVYRYDYSYYDDGRLNQLTDLDDQTGDPHLVTFHYMSRVYGYDQAGRVASVSAPPPHPYSIPAPFTGNYGYDAFNNMTSRSGQFALNPNQSDGGNYVNNRRVQTGWSYDADGRVITSADSSDSGGSSTQTWSYDAAGNEVAVSQVRNSQTTTNTLAYDGDGQVIYESVSNGTSDYLVRSTVLGSVLTGLDATGNKNSTIATPWSRHPDPTGLQENGQAYDPFGNLIYNVQPPMSPPPPYVPFYGATWGGASWSSFVNANNFGTGCQIDGLDKPCSKLWQAMQSMQIGTISISGPVDVGGLGIVPEWETNGDISRSVANYLGPVFGDDPQNPTPGLTWGKVATLDPARLKTCVEKFRVVNGNFSGTRNGGKFVGEHNGKEFSVNFDVTKYTKAGLAQYLAKHGGGRPGVAIGMAPQGDPKVYIASDLASDSNVPDIGVVAVEIHELGNKLAQRFFTERTRPRAQDPVLRKLDPDSGMAFEECVFGGLVSQNTGQVGVHQK